MEYELLVDMATCTLYEQEFNQPQGDRFIGYALDHIIGRKYDNIADLIEDIHFESDDVIPNDTRQYTFIQEGKIQAYGLANRDGYLPSAEELEKWKEGKLTLYKCVATCTITVCPIVKEHKLTQDEANQLGII